MPSDPQLSYKFASFICEIGDAIHCSISRAPDDGVLNDKTVGKARAVRVSLDMQTEGRGDTDRQGYSGAEIPIDRFGAASGNVVLPVPLDAPISYDGSLMRVGYTVTIRTDTQLSVDPKVEIPVIVVPKGGLGRYDRPHPLP